jgi:hypothetical protein
MIEFEGPRKPATLDPAQTITQSFYDDTDDTYQTHPVRMGEKTVTGRIVGRGTNCTVIPEEEVAYLASIHCTHKEIAAFYNVKTDAFRRVFNDILSRERAVTRQRLRKAQLDLALSGDKTLLIWLGKNILGQSDSPTKSDADRQVLPWTADTTEHTASDDADED